MMKIAICDDEDTICTKVEDYILDFAKRNLYRFSIDIYYTGEELLQAMKDGEVYHIIFLDIELKGMNGVQVGRSIRDILKNEYSQIVYISSKDGYYQDLFDVRPLNFVHKPIDPQKLMSILDKAIELSNRLEYFFTYQKAGITYKVFVKDILYFEASGRKVNIVTTDKIDTFYNGLDKIASSLEEFHFFLIHQSFLVNYLHVIEFGHTELKMSNHDLLPISKNKKAKVFEMFKKYESKAGYQYGSN